MKKGDINPQKMLTHPGPRGAFLRFFQVCFGKFQKLYQGSDTLDISSYWLGEMFEGDSADTCTNKFPLMSMGG